MNMFKKFTRSLVLSFFALALLINSRPSQSAVGLIVAPGLVTAGLVVVGVGAVGVAAGVISVSSRTVRVVGSLFSVTGLILLDGEQGLAYSEVSESAARKLGLTSAEIHSFNAEIDQVNAIAAHVDASLGEIENASVEDSAAAWLEVKDAVSPETFSAMQKITAQLYQ